MKFEMATESVPQKPVQTEVETFVVNVSGALEGMRERVNDRLDGLGESIDELEKSVDSLEKAVEKFEVKLHRINEGDNCKFKSRR